MHEKLLAVAENGQPLAFGRNMKEKKKKIVGRCREKSERCWLDVL